MNTPSVVIVEYGLGNLFSVAAALAKIGANNVTVSDDKDKILKADRLIIPGVGAFGDGMGNLELNGSIESESLFGFSPALSCHEADDNTFILAPQTGKSAFEYDVATGTLYLAGSLLQSPYI